MSAPTEPAPEVPVTQKREFWLLMGLRGRSRGFRRIRGSGVRGRDRLRRQVVRRFRSGLVRRALVVGGGHRGGRCRGRAAAPPDAPARADTRPVRRPENRARRHRTGSGDRRCLGGVADRRGQPGPGEGAGRHGRRGRHLVGPAKGARQRGLPGEHPGRLHRRLRWTVLQHGDRGDADPGGRPPWRATVLQGPCRGGRRIERLVRDLLRHRRRGVPGCLPGAALQLRRLAAPGRHPPWPVRGPPRHPAGGVHDAGVTAVRPPQAAEPSPNRPLAAWCSGSSGWRCR